jgi:ribosomal protein S18 acetylase RimI-like enzyme
MPMVFEPPVDELRSWEREARPRTITNLTFRAAQPADVVDAVPLIYSSGPAAFDFVFHAPGRTTAIEFLRDAFVQGGGEFGFRNHVVGVLGDAIVCAGAAWSGASNLPFTLAAARQILGHYGVAKGTGVAARGLRVESVIQPPTRQLWYVAHLGVVPELRSRGIGRALLDHLLERGRAQGHRKTALDVAVTNAQAQALYERAGFVVERDRRSTLSNDRTVVPDHRRMVLNLG